MRISDTGSDNSSSLSRTHVVECPRPTICLRSNSWWIHSLVLLIADGGSRSLGIVLQRCNLHPGTYNFFINMFPPGDQLNSITAMFCLIHLRFKAMQLVHPGLNALKLGIKWTLYTLKYSPWYYFLRNMKVNIMYE